MCLGLTLNDNVSLRFLIRLTLFSFILVLDKPHLFPSFSASKSAGVRKASVHALKNLYEVDDIAPNLGRFTRRFSSQKIGLAGDFDISVAISAIGLVKQLLRHQLLPPEIRHVIGALEYEHLIAQVFNSSQSGAKGFSSHDHGTINIAYRGENFICVGVDSKLTNALTGYVTNLTCNKFYRLSRNIYITMAGFRMSWEEMWQWMTSVFQTIPEESHTVELAANLAYHFVSPYGTVCSLVLGWDFTSPHPQMFRVIPGISLTSDSAMAVGSGEEHINLRDLTDYNYGELAHAFHNTMLLLNQACLLDPFCCGIVIAASPPPSSPFVSSAVGCGGDEKSRHNPCTNFSNEAERLAVPPTEASPDHLPLASTLYSASLGAFDSPPPAEHTALA
ncbi:unnamed protein product [Malus baccata var. baccata]